MITGFETVTYMLQVTFGLFLFCYL